MLSGALQLNARGKGAHYAIGCGRCGAGDAFAITPKLALNAKALHRSCLVVVWAVLLVMDRSSTRSYLTTSAASISAWRSPFSVASTYSFGCRRAPPPASAVAAYPSKRPHSEIPIETVNLSNGLGICRCCASRYGGPRQRGQQLLRVRMRR